MNINSLQQHVNEPTTGKNIFDLVMTTTDLSINGLEVTKTNKQTIFISNQVHIFLHNQRPDTEHRPHTTRLRWLQKEMKEELGSDNYEVIMSDKNAGECYMILKDKIATATEHHIPRKRIRQTNNPSWSSQEIKRLINARQHSYRKPRTPSSRTYPRLQGC
ncbi:hypothetical protein FHG87_023451 [Trinorchestia longiramus]|nr:hypothetical protein FHG87_023451 [Trinorchestia longiramus]